MPDHRVEISPRRQSESQRSPLLPQAAAKADRPFRRIGYHDQPVPGDGVAALLARPKLGEKSPSTLIRGVPQGSITSTKPGRASGVPVRSESLCGNEPSRRYSQSRPTKREVRLPSNERCRWAANDSECFGRQRWAQQTTLPSRSIGTRYRRAEQRPVEPGKSLYGETQFHLLGIASIDTDRGLEVLRDAGRFVSLEQER